jgi:hypothetical protein
MNTMLIERSQSENTVLLDSRLRGNDEQLVDLQTRSSGRRSLKILRTTALHQCPAFSFKLASIRANCSGVASV